MILIGRENYSSWWITNFTNPLGKTISEFILTLRNPLKLMGVLSGSCQVLSGAYDLWLTWERLSSWTKDRLFSSGNTELWSFASNVCKFMKYCFDKQYACNKEYHISISCTVMNLCEFRRLRNGFHIKEIVLTSITRGLN